jgi:hypothetical protein
VNEQPPIVDLAKSIERIRIVRIELRGCERALHEHLRALAHHTEYGLQRQRGRAVRREHFVRAVGQIAPRIDERAIEIEHHEGATTDDRVRFHCLLD